MHNIIFIFIFALIFSQLTLTELQKTNRLNLVSHFYESIVTNLQNKNNTKIENTFKKQNQKKQQVKKKSYPPNRRADILTSNAKLNIQSFQKNEYKSLLKLYENYLLLIYKNAPFFDPLIIKKIALLTAKHINRDKNLKEIQTIVLSDKKLQKVWYKMLKGTRNFTIKHPYDYPPLLDFIAFEDNTKRAPINFLKANELLLKALFKNNIYKKIIQKEAIELRALHVNELQQLCQSENINFINVKIHLQFSSSKAILQQTDTALPI